MTHTNLTPTTCLFLIEERWSFTRTVQEIADLGWSALEGKKNIECVLARQHELPLPNDGRYIVGLAELEFLEQFTYACGTLLYYVPVIYHGTMGSTLYRPGKSCFSASGEIDDFSNTYIIATKNPAS